MTLARMRPGEMAIITKIGVGGSLKRRLMDMGVLTGQSY